MLRFSHSAAMTFTRQSTRKAARLGFGLAQNHAFIDGNKRVAVLAVLMFLKGNDIEIDCTEF